jgi:hypothetical protein
MASKMTFKVLIDDNFHYMDTDARTSYGEFETQEAAIDACKQIVNECLLSAYKPGMSATVLYSNYTMFGDDPYIIGGEGVVFSAWNYAKERCAEICAEG